MSAEERIRRTLALYSQRHDDRDAEGYTALFLEDGHFFAANGADHAGRTAIHKFITNLYATQPAERFTKHMSGNSVITVHGETADAITDFVAWERLGDGPWQFHTGRYRDQFRQHGDEWLFAERRVVHLEGFASHGQTVGVDHRARTPQPSA